MNTIDSIADYFGYMPRPAVRRCVVCWLVYSQVDNNLQSLYDSQDKAEKAKTHYTIIRPDMHYVVVRLFLPFNNVVNAAHIQQNNITAKITVTDALRERAVSYMNARKEDREQEERGKGSGM
jgi:hypothetical protein